MLVIDNLSSRYGRIEVLHGLSLEVKAGEIVGIRPVEEHPGDTAFVVSWDLGARVLAGVA